MRFLMLIMLVFCQFSFSKMKQRDFSYRFSSYILGPNEDMSDDKKWSRNQAGTVHAIASIELEVRSTCMEFEMMTDWSIRSWEADDLGWISGEGEVWATFVCHSFNNGSRNNNFPNF